jgi:hypothetical protein
VFFFFFFSFQIWEVGGLVTIQKGVYIASCKCFVFSNLWGRWIGDRPKGGLAKYGYRLERKVEKFRNPATCWWHAITFSKNMATWAFFPQKAPPCTIHNTFFFFFFFLFGFFKALDAKFCQKKSLVPVLHFVKNNLLLLSSGVRHVVTLSKNFKYTIFLNNKFGRSSGG